MAVVKSRPAMMRHRASLLAASCWIFWLLPRASVAQNRTLEVWTHFGGGPNGTITVQPGDHTCLPSSSFCDYVFANGTTVTNFAWSPAGATFQGWKDCSGSSLSGNPVYSLTLNGDACVQAYFVNSAGPYTLTVYKGVPGLGNGSVSGPGGFFCGPNDGACSQPFASGTVVTLTNTPAPGWTFAYWETNGVVYSNNAPLTLTLNGDRLVQAIFLHNNQPPAVSVIKPTNDAPVWVCAASRITASASDPDGSVTRLEIFLGGTNGPKLGEQSFDLSTNGAPVLMSIGWKTNVLGATNTFVARATDNSGDQTVSSPVAVTTVLPPLHYLIAYGITVNRECEMCMNGQTGRVYSVLATTNLAITNVASWSNLGAMQGTNGFLRFLDPAFTNLSRRFYRAVQQ
jgi:hypothetical protein